MSGLEAISAIVGAVSAVGSGIAQKNAAAAQAGLARRQALRERQIADRDADLFARQESARRADIIAQRGALGVALRGTPLLFDNVLIGDALLGEETIRRQGIAKASDLEAQARLTQFRGRTARAAGFFKATTGLLDEGKAIRTLLTDPKKAFEF